MNCKQAYQHIILEVSGRKFEKHLDECSSCKELQSKVNNVMANLDVTADVPEGLAEAVLARKKDLTAHNVSRWNLAGYAQLAALLLFGIFMGHILGKNASSELLHRKPGLQINKYEMQPFNIDYAGFDFYPYKLIRNKYEEQKD